MAIFFQKLSDIKCMLFFRERADESLLRSCVLWHLLTSLSAALKKPKKKTLLRYYSRRIKTSLSSAEIDFCTFVLSCCIFLSESRSRVFSPEDSWQFSLLSETSVIFFFFFFGLFPPTIFSKRFFSLDLSSFPSCDCFTPPICQVSSWRTWSLTSAASPTVFFFFFFLLGK